jgi:predicted Zn-dependent peptidase
MRSILIAVPLALGAISPAWAQKTPPQSTSGTAAKLHVPYEKYQLPNGLEVILHEDHRLPVVAVDVWYHVGAFHEPPGRSGFAHLFEHMMFQGSQHVADDQHIALLERIGANDINGSTNFYRTNYFETVPSNHLETALWLESDRMGFLPAAITPASLNTQREVVKNERRQRIETAPYGMAEEALWQTLFPEPHPYHGFGIGSMKDLDAATLDDVKEFFRTWYAPSNATLAIAGDFDPAQAKKLVEKYFGTLPSRPEPKPQEVAPVKLTRELVIRHDEEVAALPGVFLSWHSPALFAEGDAEADVLASILTYGKSSRLHRRLVREKQLAESVSANQQSLNAQSVFEIEAVVAPGKDPAAVQKEIDAVLDDIRRKGVSADEVKRARNRIETGFVAGLQAVGGAGGKADLLQAYNHFFGEPDGFARDLARYEAVTPEKVQTFVNEYLSPTARVVAIATPKPGKRQAPSAAAPEVKR